MLLTMPDARRIGGVIIAATGIWIWTRLGQVVLGTAVLFAGLWTMKTQ